MAPRSNAAGGWGNNNGILPRCCAVLTRGWAETGLYISRFSWANETKSQAESENERAGGSFQDFHLSANSLASELQIMPLRTNI
jgi:hypothetical protein